MTSTVRQPAPGTFTRVPTFHDEPGHPGITLRLSRDGKGGATSHIIRLPEDEGILRCCLERLGALGWADYLPTGLNDPLRFAYREGWPTNLYESITRAGSKATPTLIIVNASESEVANRAENGVPTCSRQVEVEVVR